MKALSMPFHIDIHGSVATSVNYADIMQGQLVDVLMTNQLERVMRPEYGADLQRSLFDPSDELVRSDAARQVMQRCQQYAPRVTMESVRFSLDSMRPGQVYVDVSFRASAFDEVQAVRLPVTPFLNEETPL